jgi:8-oxo-dGTP pyrophosphatase MutT (NUDIX family)
MSAFSSKKQYRLLTAILNGKKLKTVETKSSGIKKAETKGVGVIVVDDEGKILIGQSAEHNGAFLMPGGSIDEGESAEQAAIRELEEETGLKATSAEKQDDDEFGSVFVVRNWTGNPESTREIQNPKFMSVNEIPWSYMRSCCVPGLTRFIAKKLKKSKKLIDMVMAEKLQKNIIRNSQVSGAVYELTHGDALKLVGNGAYRILRNGVKGMGDDEVKEVKMGQYTLVIRKHANDIYSGHIRDGHKTIHHFVNRSLPAATAELMSVFEWYLPEDIPELEIEDDEKMPDSVVDDGLSRMISNYRHYNLADIYDEMESIREEVRHGMAVDLQQVEERMGKLIDKLEERLDVTSDKHNDLSRALGADIDEIEAKLKQIRSNVKVTPESSSISAVVSEKPDVKSVLSNFYEYLSKPSVTIEPSGRIHITFAHDWSNLDQGNFLTDLKAKALKKN